jgi:truncated hemoglobin YjbI
MVSLDIAVDRFYDRLLADPQLAGFFDSVDMRRQRAHQKAFLAMPLGGPRAIEAAASPRRTLTSTSTTITSTSWRATSSRCWSASTSPRSSSTRS